MGGGGGARGGGGGREGGVIECNKCREMGQKRGSKERLHW